MDGILIIDKPAGITSHDVVARCRKILKTKRVGHAGTLDPFATGVMVVLVGKATRVAQFLDKDAKEYEAIVRFGFETDTGDLTGNPKSEVQNLKFVSVDEVQNILAEFRGEIEQTPPMYSAKKIQGKKLYELARKGVEVERAPQKITIYGLEVQSSDLEVQGSDIPIRVVCSAGSYIRTLAEDIGKKLGTGAHLAALRRTRAGNFDLSKAVTIDGLEEIVSANKLPKILIPMNEAVSFLPEIVLSPAEIEKMRNGMKLKLENAELKNNEAVRMIDNESNLVAVGVYNEPEKFVQPKTVLV